MITINNRKLDIQDISVENRDDKLILDLVKKVFEIFANKPHNLYLVNDSDLIRYISPQKIFITDEYVHYDRLMSFTPTNGNHFCINIGVTFEIFREKLKLDDSVLTLVRCAETNEICAGFFSYQSTMQKVFKHFEEWENPLLFAGIKKQELYRIYDQFKAEVSLLLNCKINDDTPIYIPNLLFADPSVRNSFKLSAAFACRLKNHIPENDMICIVECNKGSLAYKLFNDLETEKIAYSFDPYNDDYTLIVLKNILSIKKRFCVFP